jgi:hypothetical protein
VRALFADDPAPLVHRRRVGTRRALVRAGLTNDEIRILQGFRGLSPAQQASLLTWTADAVIAHARSGGLS